MIKPPPAIAAAARARVKKAMDQIRHSVGAIADGRPGDAEQEMARREQVYQARMGVSLEEARNRTRSADGGQERIFGKTIDFVDVAFFERGYRAARAVARIVTRDGAGFGTGFMISPRLLMTNNHVIASAAEAAGLLAEFDYQRNVSGQLLKVTRFAFAPQDCFLTNDQDDLDYTVIGVGERVAGEKSLAQFGCVPVSNARNKHQLGDHVNIIQHPDGRPKEAVLRENQLVARAGTALHYLADTEPGASGSPVFNVQFALVALHHWGTPHRELIGDDGKSIPKTVNEGIRASSIHADLSTLRTALKPGPRSLVDEALRLGLATGGTPPVRGDQEVGAFVADDNQSRIGVQVAEDGTATWNIPLTVSVRLGDRAATSNAATAAAAQGGTSTATGSGREARLELDPDYDARPGYNPDFLDGFSVPLPTLSPALRQIAAKNTRARAGDNPHELKYHHFSVIMNGERRLAFVSAVNINGALAKDFDRDDGIITDPFEDEGDQEATELWFPEPRIHEDQQTPRNFYQGQTTFDAAGRAITNKRKTAHLYRLFQQGHLTRRQDPVWGEDDQLIKFANADTFHVTNCAPQIGFFNMGVFRRRGESRDTGEAAKKHPGGILHWRALEEYVMTNARAQKQKLTVFTGPIFDDRNDYDWSRGRPEMEGFKAPREYWKLILRVDDNEPQAIALVADQSPLIIHLPEMILRGEAIDAMPFEKVSQYHVNVAELEARTGLKFGDAVRQADTFVPRGSGAGQRRRRIETVTDVTLTRPRQGRPKTSGGAAKKRAAKRGRKAARG